MALGHADFERAVLDLDVQMVERPFAAGGADAGVGAGADDDVIGAGDFDPGEARDGEDAVDLGAGVGAVRAVAAAQRDDRRASGE